MDKQDEQAGTALRRYARKERGLSEQLQKMQHLLHPSWGETWPILVVRAHLAIAEGKRSRQTDVSLGRTTRQAQRRDFQALLPQNSTREAREEGEVLEAKRLGRHLGENGSQQEVRQAPRYCRRRVQVRNGAFELAFCNTEA